MLEWLTRPKSLYTDALENWRTMFHLKQAAKAAVRRAPPKKVFGLHEQHTNRHTWLRVKNRYPKWNPGKPVVPWWFNFDPQPHRQHEIRPSTTFAGFQSRLTQACPRGSHAWSYMTSRGNSFDSASPRRSSLSSSRVWVQPQPTPLISSTFVPIKYQRVHSFGHSTRLAQCFPFIWI